MSPKGKHQLISPPEESKPLINVELYKCGSLINLPVMGFTPCGITAGWVPDWAFPPPGVYMALDAHGMAPFQRGKESLGWRSSPPVDQLEIHEHHCMTDMGMR